MNWIILKDIAGLDDLDKQSEIKKAVILKHSTRCSISTTALDRLQRKWEPLGGEKFDWYYLDLIAYRNVSNAIAQRYNVQHESPQVLVIENGKCIYHDSHYGVQYEDVIAK